MPRTSSHPSFDDVIDHSSSCSSSSLSSFSEPEEPVSSIATISPTSLSSTGQEGTDQHFPSDNRTPPHLYRDYNQKLHNSPSAFGWTSFQPLPYSLPSYPMPYWTEMKYPESECKSNPFMTPRFSHFQQQSSFYYPSMQTMEIHSSSLLSNDTSSSFHNHYSLDRLTDVNSSFSPETLIKRDPHPTPDLRLPPISELLSEHCESSFSNIPNSS